MSYPKKTSILIAFLILLLFSFESKSPSLFKDLAALKPFCEEKYNRWEGDRVPKLTLEAVFRTNLSQTGWYDVAMGEQHQKILWSCNGDTCKVLIKKGGAK
jgi:hypothetical protein